MTAFKKISSTFSPFASEASVELETENLRQIVYQLPTLAEVLEPFLNAIDLSKARNNLYAELWLQEEKFPDLTDAQYVSDSLVCVGFVIIHLCQQALMFVESDLQEHLKEGKRT